MVCGGTLPWSGVFLVLLCPDTHSLDTHCSALTPGDKEYAGDIQMSPATRLGVLLGGCSHDGESPQQTVGGAGVGDRGCGGSPAPTEPHRHSTIAEGLQWNLGVGSTQPQ